MGIVRERGTLAAGDAAGSPGGGVGECWAGSGARKNLKTKVKTNESIREAALAMTQDRK